MRLYTAAGPACFTSTTNATIDISSARRRRTSPKTTNPANKITIRDGMMVREGVRALHIQTEQENKRKGPSIPSSITKKKELGRNWSRSHLVSSLLCFLYFPYSVQTVYEEDEEEAISLAGKWIAVLAAVLCTAHGTSSSFRSPLYL